MAQISAIFGPGFRDGEKWSGHKSPRGEITRIQRLNSGAFLASHAAPGEPSEQGDQYDQAGPARPRVRAERAPASSVQFSLRTCGAARRTRACIGSARRAGTRIGSFGAIVVRREAGVRAVSAEHFGLRGPRRVACASDRALAVAGEWATHARQVQAGFEAFAQILGLTNQEAGLKFICAGKQAGVRPTQTAQLGARHAFEREVRSTRAPNAVVASAG